MFVCIAINKDAEPNSLVVQCDFATRDAMIEEQPDLYYTAAHYANYACVLVRLSKVDRTLNPMPYKKAQSMEAVLADSLRKRGFAVFGGH